LIFDNQETTEEKNDVDRLDERDIDPVFEIIERVNESLINEFLEKLVLEIGSRPTNSEGCEKAGNYIFSQFKEVGLDTRYHEWRSRSLNLREVFMGKNVIATIPGKGELRNEILIVNAHYDTVDVPGGIDNGGGTVAVMAAAYALSQYEFNRTIKFIAFSGEENGLLGSRAYVNEIYEDDPDILIEFNLDGVGYATTAKHGKGIRLSTTVDARWICEEIKTVNRNYDLDFNIRYRRIIKPGGPRSYTSDFFDFALHGYEAIAFSGSESYQHWHTPEDTYDKVNISYLTNVTKLVVASLAYMADIEVYYPQIKITSPRRGVFYLGGRTIFNFNYERTVVIDDIIISAEVKPGDSAIEKVEFYYDNKLVLTDTDMPYQWKLDKRSIQIHNVKVILHDEKGRTAEDQIDFRFVNFFRII
jgi:aminopeptidase YwaD